MFVSCRHADASCRRSVSQLSKGKDKAKLDTKEAEKIDKAIANVASMVGKWAKKQEEGSPPPPASRPKKK